MLIKAAVTNEKGQFTFEEVELDEPKADEVLVKIVASGCCHTDLGGRDQMAPWPIPGVLGHEGAGIVEKVGSMVHGIKPGDPAMDGLQIYPKNAETIKPDFKTTEPFTKAQIPIDAMMVVDKTEDHSDDAEEYWDISRSTAMLINYDSIADELRSQPYSFENVVRNQLKYLIQEVVFFDKHTSRLHTKIMAIAPLHPVLISTQDSTKVMASLRESIMFWIPFDNLRPYLAMQYSIPNRNEVKRVTFDEFFQKRLFTSYIVGEGNMYNRWIPDYSGSEEEVRKEQERIATELLNFEQDLWEY